MTNHPAGVRLCENRIGSHRYCNEVLRATKTVTGRTAYKCLRCTWREEQRCWQCGSPRTNHPTMGVYCDACAAERDKANITKWHADPEQKARRREKARQRAAERKWERRPR